MGNYQKNTLSIKNWAEEDRPREKLSSLGSQVLSNAELIAILLGSGNTKETAVDVAKRILMSVNGDLNELGKCTKAELTKFYGVGEAKAIVIAAAMELGRRRQLLGVKDKPLISCSRDVYNLLGPQLADLPHEEFWILLLNRANRVLSKERVSQGGTSATIVDPKIIFRKAIEGGASAIIVCHNHPSGNLLPSKADKEITKKLKEAGKVLEINVFDHIIISEKGFFSFEDEGLF